MKRVIFRETVKPGRLDNKEALPTQSRIREKEGDQIVIRPDQTQEIGRETERARRVRVSRKAEANLAEVLRAETRITLSLLKKIEIIINCGGI